MMKMCDIKMTIPWSMVIILTILTVNAEAQADSETSLDTAERRTATAQNGNGILKFFIQNFVDQSIMLRLNMTNRIDNL